MRTVTIALAAIPVVCGGIGLATVASPLDTLSPLVPAAEDGPIGAEGSSTDEVTKLEAAVPLEIDGTEIDGRRPHLTVVDGRTDLVLPAPLTAILPQMPEFPTELSPLSASVRVTDVPPTSDADLQPAPHTDMDPTSAGADDPAIPPAPPIQITPGTPAPPAVPRTYTPPQATDPLDGEGPPGLHKVTRENQAATTPGAERNSIRPDHAGSPGPPAHAADNGGPERATSANAYAYAYAYEDYDRPVER